MADKIKNKANKILKILDELYPEAVCALNFENPLQLLVATILSAQCTDIRVNIVTKELFKKYKSAGDFAAADLAELEKDIHSTGFFKNKARSIKESCQEIVSKYAGRVPGSLEELISLRGIGRKTANVVLGNAFGTPGIVVDTHVIRLSRRLGLTENEDPVKIEFDLMEIFSEKRWTLISHQIVNHGRAVCNARSPKCTECLLIELCDFYKGASNERK